MKGSEVWRKYGRKGYWIKSALFDTKGLVRCGFVWQHGLRAFRGSWHHGKHLPQSVTLSASPPCPCWGLGPTQVSMPCPLLPSSRAFLEACAHLTGLNVSRPCLSRWLRDVSPAPCAGPGACCVHPRTGTPDRVHAGRSTTAQAKADDR